MSDFTPIPVGGEDDEDQVVVDVYRAIFGGNHYVHVTAVSNGSSLYFGPEEARALASALEAAADAAEAAKKAEEASHV